MLLGILKFQSVVVVVAGGGIAVVVAIVVLVSKANSHYSQNSLVLSSELPTRGTIYEGVDSTTQIR